MKEMENKHQFSKLVVFKVERGSPRYTAMHMEDNLPTLKQRTLYPYTVYTFSRNLVLGQSQVFRLKTPSLP